MIIIVSSLRTYTATCEPYLVRKRTISLFLAANTTSNALTEPIKHVALVITDLFGFWYME